MPSGRMMRRNSAFDRDEWVFVPDKTSDKAWVPGRIVGSKDGPTVTLELENGTRTDVKKAEFAKLEMCGSSMNLDLDNLVDLDAFSEGSILHHVRKVSSHIFVAFTTHLGSV